MSISTRCCLGYRSADHRGQRLLRLKRLLQRRTPLDSTTKIIRANQIGCWLRAEARRLLGVLIASGGGNERHRAPALVAGLAKMRPHTVGNVAIRGLGAEVLDVPFALREDPCSLRQP